MIDFHSHVLPGLDDGVRTMKETIELAQEAKKAGFDRIIATSHYYPNFYTTDEEKRKKVLSEVKKNTKEYIKFNLGNEIYINSDIAELIKTGEASTINSSKYILFEISLKRECPEMKNIIIDLISKGYYLILAHPERYEVFQKDPTKLEEILDLGVYLQANFLSILGFYGKDARKTVELLFKHNMISFLGTDVHKTKIYYPRVKDASKKIINIIGEDKFEEITNTNPMLVLTKREIEQPYYTKIKKGILGNYK